MLPRVRTFAGEAVWFGGVFLFLMGYDRRITWATYMKLNWNKTTEKILVAESKLTAKRVFDIYKSDKVITFNSILRLGLADGFYIGHQELVRKVD